MQRVFAVFLMEFKMQNHIAAFFFFFLVNVRCSFGLQYTSCSFTNFVYCTYWPEFMHLNSTETVHVKFLDKKLIKIILHFFFFL